MSTNEPAQAATEEAAAQLLHMAFIEIRFLAAPLVEDDSYEALIGRRDQIHELADICHNLPGLLGPQRRHRLGDGLRYMWRGASPRKQHWIRSCWDHLGYDHHWLPGTADSSVPAAERASGG